MRLIVGIDPGTTIGLAVFDFNFEPVAISTLNDCGKEGIVKEILKYGTPSIVATDVVSPPDSVIQIASYFNARLFSPDADIHENEKEILTKELSTHNNHERDSAAAVMVFLNRNVNTIRSIKKVLKEKDLTEFESDILQYVLTGVRLTDALKYLELLTKSKTETTIQSDEIPKDNYASKQATKPNENNRILLASLLKSNSILKSRLSILFAEKKALEEKVKCLESEYGADIKVDKLLNHKNTKIKKLELLLKRQRTRTHVKSKTPRKKPIKTSSVAELDLDELVDDYRKNHKIDS